MPKRPSEPTNSRSSPDRAFEALAAELDQLAIREDDAQAEHVVGRHPWRRQCAPPELNANVAAESCTPTGSTGRAVAQPVWRRGRADGGVDGARLHPRGPLLAIDGEDAVEPVERVHDAASIGSEPPESDVPLPRGTNGTPCGMTGADDLRDLGAASASRSPPAPLETRSARQRRTRALRRAVSRR